MNEQEALLKEFCDLVDDDYARNFQSNLQRLAVLADLIHDPCQGREDLPSALWKLLNCFVDETDNGRKFNTVLEIMLPKALIYMDDDEGMPCAWPIVASHIPDDNDAAGLIRDAFIHLEKEELQTVSHLSEKIAYTEAGLELVRSMLLKDVQVPVLLNFISQFQNHYDDTNIVSVISTISYDIEDKVLSHLQKMGLDLTVTHELIGPIADADWEYLVEHPLLEASGKSMVDIRKKHVYGNLLTVAAEQNEMRMFQTFIKAGMDHNAPSVRIDNGAFLSTKEYLELMNYLPSNGRLGIERQQYLDLMKTMDASQAASDVLKELLPAQVASQQKP